jgi:uncharacterized protein YbcI
MSVDRATLSPHITRIGGANGAASPQIHQAHFAAVGDSGICREEIRRGDSGIGGCTIRSRMDSRRGVIERKTAGEVEAAVCRGVVRFQQEFVGRGPRDIRAHLHGDLLVVRLQGVLTAAEQQLGKSLSGEKGPSLLKQVRTHLIEIARPLLEAMVEEVTGIKVLSLHHDISTLTGEEVILFTLAKLPDVRETKTKH